MLVRERVIRALEAKKERFAHYQRDLRDHADLFQAALGQLAALSTDAIEARLAATNVVWPGARPTPEHDQADGVVFPTSMIFGLGHRYAGGWIGTRGAIANGFAAGREFHVTGIDQGDRPDYEIWTDWQTLPGTTPEGLPPHKACEEWIVHSGGWLSAISRWHRHRRR